MLTAAKKVPLFFTIIFLITACSSKNPSEDINKKGNEPEIKLDAYGIPVDSFKVELGKVGKNQTFADLLLPYDIPYKRILEIADANKDSFDVRKIKRGDSYRIYLMKDSTSSLRYFVYEPDAINYYLFSFDSLFSLTKSSKPIIIKQRSAAGEITYSLYETLSEQKISPQVAMALSDIFAWQIDFYRIMKGDAFKVIYDEKFVDGKFIGIGKVKAAWFKNMNQEYYAFYFNQKDNDDYFDEEGNSLRKAFLKAPVKFSRISSHYTLRRFHPVLHRMKAHLGTDYAAPYGTPILATGDGVVIEARYKRNNGNYVKIRHNGTYTTQYLHMQKIKRGIRPGVKVKQGDVIGFVGSTGLATGPHVCYRFWKNGKQVNHLREKFPSSNPIDHKFADEFERLKNEMKMKLDELLLPSNKLSMDEVID